MFERSLQRKRRWDTISIKGRIINGEEKAYWTETLHDDAYWVIEEKDLGKERWDTQITNSREYGGERLDFLWAITLDNSVTEEERTYTTFFKFHDRPEKMGWWRVGMYAMAVDQGGDWLGWVQTDSQAGTGESNRGVIAAEIVRKLKAWNGLDFVF